MELQSSIARKKLKMTQSKLLTVNYNRLCRRSWKKWHDCINRNSTIIWILLRPRCNTILYAMSVSSETILSEKTCWKAEYFDYARSFWWNFYVIRNRFWTVQSLKHMGQTCLWWNEWRRNYKNVTRKIFFLPSVVDERILYVLRIWLSLSSAIIGFCDKKSDKADEARRIIETATKLIKCSIRDDLKKQKEHIPLPRKCLQSRCPKPWELFSVIWSSNLKYWAVHSKNYFSQFADTSYYANLGIWVRSCFWVALAYQRTLYAWFLWIIRRNFEI